MGFSAVQMFGEYSQATGPVKTCDYIIFPTNNCHDRHCRYLFSYKNAKLSISKAVRINEKHSRRHRLFISYMLKR